MAADDRGCRSIGDRQGQGGQVPLCAAGLQGQGSAKVLARRFAVVSHRLGVPLGSGNRTFTFAYDDRIDLTLRALQYAWCTYAPKVLSDKPAMQYLMAM